MCFKTIIFADGDTIVLWGNNISCYASHTTYYSNITGRKEAGFYFIKM